MAGVFEALDRAVEPGTQRPCLAADIEVARFSGRWQGEHAVVHNPRTHTYFRLSGAEADLIDSFDGTTTVHDLSVTVMTTDDGLAPEEVAGLVDFLHRRGFLTTPWVDSYALLTSRIARPSTRLLDRAWRRLATLTIRFPGARRFIDVIYGAGGRFAFSVGTQILMFAVLVAGVVAFATESRRATFTLLGPPTTAAAATLFGLGLVALFFHEVGHALAIRHAGRQVLGAGFQLYLANPAFFIDSSDMVMAPRTARAINAIAGPYTEGAVASVAALGALVAGPTAIGEVLFRFAGVTYVFTLINLVPFLELDGYWLLTDLLDIPDLRPRALAFLRYDLRERIVARRSLTRGEWGLTLFGTVGVAFTVVAFVLAWLFWWPIARAFGGGIWRLGAAGRVLLVVLIALVLGPVAHGLGDGARAIARWVKGRSTAIRFRLERRWRVAAGEVIAALPVASKLTEEELNDIAGRVRRRRFEAGEALVRQGDAAAAFYAIRHGRCAVVEERHGGGEVVITHLDAGSTFGELALLEGTTRTATVRAESAGEVFVIDIGTFQRILAESLTRPDLAPATWPVTEVWTLQPFRHLGLAAATDLAGSGSWVRVAPGEEIVREAEVGDTFFVVGSGQCEVERDGVVIAALRAGDFFGELALLRDEPRVATVRAVTSARLFAVPRHAFDHVVRAAFGSGHLASCPEAKTHSARAVTPDRRARR